MDDNPTRNDGGRPEDLPSVTITFDPATQQPTVHWENIRNFEYALALIRMAELMVEQQRRVAALQQTKIVPSSVLPLSLPRRERG